MTVGLVDGTVDRASIRHIWLVPLLQAIAIAVMAVVTWVVRDPAPTVLDEKVSPCEVVLDNLVDPATGPCS